MAPYLAVMDADLQHDPNILRDMLRALGEGPYNLAVGSRYVEGGGTGEWSQRRRQYSRLATMVSHFVTHQTQITDPMSGFFMIKRELFRKTVPGLCGKGFKILLDIISTAREGVVLIEFPYTFRTRLAGESKLSVSIILEFAILLLDKTFGQSHSLPISFYSFW